jgi:serine/threonine protein kinase/formylglycine-generating enzyme required for sulfatase activity
MAKKIGPYEIIEKLGDGQMGMVYKAKKDDGTLVALKVLKSELAEASSFVRRFEREAKASLTFDHPYLVKAFDVGKAEGYYFFAMEYVDGEDLQLKLKRGESLDEGQALYVAKCVAEALQFAWERNIVHRDIKPANIMIQVDGRIRLMDLGLAKDVTDENATVTQAGGVLGSPAYAAPEQLEGKVDVDVRADLYALGTTLFHLTCGRPPFIGPSAGVVASNNLTEPLPNPKEINPDLSEPFCELLGGLTEKKADDRFQNPTDFLEAIERVLKGESVSKNRSTKAIPGAVSRSRIKASATRDEPGLPFPPYAAVLVLMIGLGAVYFFKQRDSGPRHLTRANKGATPKQETKSVNRREVTPDRGKATEEVHKLPAAMTAGKSGDDHRQAERDAPQTADSGRLQQTDTSQPTSAAKNRTEEGNGAALQTEKTKPVDPQKTEQVKVSKVVVPQWAPLIPEVVNVQNGSTLSLRPDYSLLMSRANAKTEVYGIRMSSPLDKITGVRIEVLPDPVWGGQLSPCAGGKFALTEFEVFRRVKGGALERVVMGAAEATHSQGDQPISNVIDGKAETPWGIHPRGKEAQTAMVLPRVPVKGTKDELLLVRIRQEAKDPGRLIGRFRISVTDFESPDLTAPLIKSPPIQLPPLTPRLLGNTVLGKGKKDLQQGTLNVYAGSPVPAPGFIREILIHTEGLGGRFGFHILRPSNGKHQLVYSHTFESKKKGIVTFKLPALVVVEKGDLIAHHAHFGATYVVRKDSKDLTFHPFNVSKLKSAAKLDLSKEKRTESPRAYLLSAHFIPDPVRLPAFRSKKEQAWHVMMESFWDPYIESMRSKDFDAAMKTLGPVKEHPILHKNLSGDVEHMRGFFKRVDAGMPTMIGRTVRVKGIGMKVHRVENGRLKLKQGATEIDLGSEILDQTIILKLGLPQGKTQTHVKALYHYLFSPSAAIRSIEAAIEAGSHMGVYLSRMKPRLLLSCTASGAKAEVHAKSRGHWVPLRTNETLPLELEMRSGGTFRVTVNKTGYSPEEIQVVPNRKGDFIQKVTLRKIRLPAGFKRASGGKDRFDNPIRKKGIGALPGEIVHRKSDMHMVLMPSGEFTMGSAADKPKHKVRISLPFYVGKYEMTQSEWAKAMPKEKSHSSPDMPATSVDWHKIQELVLALNKGLGSSGRFAHVSEAQWEYACRAGSTGKYCFGDNAAKLGEYAWFSGNSGGKMKVVGGKKPNAWGVYDMHGNAWEFVFDGWGNYSSKPQRDPLGPENPKECVVRGLGANKSANDVRCSIRQKWSKKNPNGMIGFRLVLNLR